MARHPPGAPVSSAPPAPRSRAAHPPVPFIVGVARSGTTLLRMLLDTHPQMAIPGETHFIPHAARTWRTAGNPVQAFLDYVTSDPHWPDFQLDANRFASQLLSEAHDFESALDVFYASYAARFGKPRWGDKTPPYLDRMSDIARWYPPAHFLHVIRDGRDVALSVKDQPFGPNSVKEAARNWARRLAGARQQADKLPNYLEVRYEDLVQRTETELRRVCAFIGLDYTPVMLRYDERARARLAEECRDLLLPDRGITISGEDRMRIHHRVLGPPDASRIGRWRNAMSAREKRQFSAIAGDVLTALGYPLT
jgi:hypothetical protein